MERPGSFFGVNSLSLYLSLQFPSQDKGVSFFDRGIVDTVQLNREQGTHFDKASKKFKYHKTVFMLPPWRDIYRSDKERKHSFEQAVEEYEQLLTTYKKYGYTIVIVPKDSVSKRADMIISSCL